MPETLHPKFDLSGLADPVDPSQVVGSRTVAYAKQGFIERAGTTAEAGARPALTEHRQPPDSQYLTTGLPSGCILYPNITNNSLGIRRFNNEDVLKVYDARAEESFRMLVEVIGATLDRFNVWDLTVGDFWYLMYWHRIHSYPKSPFVVDWTCRDASHLARLDPKHEPEEERLSVESLQQQMIVKRSDLEPVNLDPKFLHEVAAIKHEFSVTTTAMRMDDYTRIIEMEEENDSQRADLIKQGKKPVSKYKPSDFVRARHASLLARVHGLTLEERMQALMTLADFSLWPRLDKLNEASDHGVVETYNVRCSHCQAAEKVEVALDALTFLPEL